MTRNISHATGDMVDLEQWSLPQLVRRAGEATDEERPRIYAWVLKQGFDACASVFEAGLRDDDDFNLRNGAMDLWVAFGGAGVARLLELLADDNEEVRNFCAVMLGRIADPRAVDPLITALRDNDANVRHAAAEALGLIGDERALAPLKELSDGDVWDQVYAAEAIVALARGGRNEA